ncbi:MAG: hypothetical protein ABSA18_11265 [Dehalococcoidia bacterium]|jgi:hypothetical protein
MASKDEKTPMLLPLLLRARHPKRPVGEHGGASPPTFYPSPHPRWGD